jgi:hypothetical protein
MQAIVTSPSPTCVCADAVRHREGTQSSRLTQVQAETHTSADITLVTAEGDKVTLSTDAVMQAAYTRYDARGRLRMGLRGIPKPSNWLLPTISRCRSQGI